MQLIWSTVYRLQDRKECRIQYVMAAFHQITLVCNASLCGERFAILSYYYKL